MGYLHGVEREDLLVRELYGQRLGLITNPSGVSRNLRATVDLIYEKFDLRALFSAEHGVRGDAQAGAHVKFYTDDRTGLPVYTMYGSDHTEALAAFEELDTIVYDIQDVGLRFYTYIYTLAEAMKAAAEKGKRVVVLDRANPLGLARVEGSLLDENFTSGVGKYALPSRYGLTVGEFAGYINQEYEIGCDLSVVPCADLRRGDNYEALGIPWVLPSPNLPTIESTICYTGTVLFEGTNLSEGRGTTKPFEMIGAPWLRSDELVEHFNSRGVAGAILRPAYFTPSFSKHAGTLCRGIQIHITDKAQFEPFKLGLELVDYIRKTHSEFRFRDESEDAEIAKEQKIFIDLLLGSRALRSRDFDAESFMAKENLKLAAFKQRAKKYWLYEE